MVLFPDDLKNGDRRRKGLLILGSFINGPDHIHAPDDLAKRGIPLSVRVILTAKVEPRLIADTDKEFGRGRARLTPRQRYDPIRMQDMTLLRRLIWYAGKTRGPGMVGLPDATL